MSQETPARKRKCAVATCGRRVKSMTLCGHHLARYRQGEHVEIATCTYENCDRPFYARKWCARHYHRWLQHGDPGVVLAPSRTPVEDRFWLTVDVRGPQDCWLWTGPVDVGGYGYLSVHSRQRRAHVTSLYLYDGEWPTSRVTQTCGRKRCVNPVHLRQEATSA